MSDFDVNFNLRQLFFGLAQTGAKKGAPVDFRLYLTGAGAAANRTGAKPVRIPRQSGPD
jgi:hypothetical protein